MDRKDFSAADGAVEQVPRIAWERLLSRTPITGGNPDCIYKAFLGIPDGRRVPVDVCKSPNPQQEVVVLRHLENVIGVPKVYGVTEPAPEALVMEFCYGSSLKVWMIEGKGRICLTALLHVCVTLRRMHSMGVTHGDLMLHNIIVNNKEDGDLEVFLVGFHLARRNATQEDIKADEKQMLYLATVIVRSVDEVFDSSIYNRRGQILRYIDQHLTLVEIAMVVCGVLNKHSSEVVL